MALQAFIKVNGRKYGLVEAQYSFNQTLENSGRPQSIVHGGEIKMVMPATSDDDQFFYRWMFDQTQVYSGYLKFTIYSADNRKVYKTVSFENAYCVELRDFFSNNDSKLMYSTITLRAEKMAIGSPYGDQALFSNEWSDIDEADGAQEAAPESDDDNIESV